MTHKNGQAAETHCAHTYFDLLPVRSPSGVVHARRGPTRTVCGRRCWGWVRLLIANPVITCKACR